MPQAAQERIRQGAASWVARRQAAALSSTVGVRIR